MTIKYNPKLQRFYDTETSRIIKKSRGLKSSIARKEYAKEQRRLEREKKAVLKLLKKEAEKISVLHKKKIVKKRKKRAIKKFPKYEPEFIPEGYEVFGIDAEAERAILAHEELNLKTKEQSLKNYFDSFMDIWNDVDYEQDVISP